MEMRPKWGLDKDKSGLTKNNLFYFILFFFRKNILRLISTKQNSANAKVIIKIVTGKTDGKTLELGPGKFSRSSQSNFHKLSNAKG